MLSNLIGKAKQKCKQQWTGSSLYNTPLPHSSKSDLHVIISLFFLSSKKVDNILKYLGMTKKNYLIEDLVCIACTKPGKVFKLATSNIEIKINSTVKKKLFTF